MGSLGLDDFVNESVVECFVGGHEKVAVRVFGDFFNGLVAVVGHVFVEGCLDKEDFLGLDLNVGGLSLGSSEGLVDHDAGVGERFALAGRSGSQQKGSHAGGHAKANRLDIAGDELHRVVNGKAGRHGPTGRIDVESNVLVGVFVGQVQQLSHQHVAHLIVDIGPQQQYTILEQPGNHIELTRLTIDGRKRRGIAWWWRGWFRLIGLCAYKTTTVWGEFGSRQSPEKKGGNKPRLRTASRQDATQRRDTHTHKCSRANRCETLCIAIIHISIIFSWFKNSPHLAS